jgi:hypothetical protein
MSSATSAGVPERIRELISLSLSNSSGCPEAFRIVIAIVRKYNTILIILKTVIKLNCDIIPYNAQGRAP